MSCDVYRPAAIEQLKTVAAQAGRRFLPVGAETEAAEIALQARSITPGPTTTTCSSSTPPGRLAIDEPMMQEIAALHAALKPVETLFVVDAMQGQDAVNVAQAHSTSALPLTGIVLTKLDGDARGGAALSVRQVTGKPIKFAGIGEKLAGLEPFHPERMASRILGMGDILSLVEEAQQAGRPRAGAEARRQGEDGQGLRPGGLQAADGSR